MELRIKKRVGGGFPELLLFDLLLISITCLSFTSPIAFELQQHMANLNVTSNGKSSHF